MNQQDEAKKCAARRALDEFVVDGMKLGLGSGTTSHFFVRALGAKVRDGLNITAAATSSATTAVARQVGIAVTDLNDIGELDLTVDGPDEIDRRFRMLKGGGACLLWEKIVAAASRKMITICDESKIVESLGKFPLPVEVVRFGWQHTRHAIGRKLDEHGIEACGIQIRKAGGAPVVTDSCHFILDCRCGKIPDPEKLEAELNTIPGVVENGLFTRQSDGMVVGYFDGASHVAMRRRGG
ncbi:MAG: ribose-5-phosphate isomerase RpiA [Gammaproteobacteria bacterium]|nr:ribose-5-phosphate isomerase RpiA [Gammaproteobacteria bacterium]